MILIGDVSFVILVGVAAFLFLGAGVLGAIWIGLVMWIRHLVVNG